MVTESRRHAVGRAPYWALAAVVTGGVLSAAAIATGVVVVSVARRVLTPPKRREEDTRVLGFDPHAETITFSRSRDAVLPGHYSFWFAGGTGHARVGDIVAETPRSVTRRVLQVDAGDLASARRGRFNGWLYLHPQDLGHVYEDVAIITELGEAPAWLVPAPRQDASGSAKRWVVNVHGRGAGRAEALRAVPVFHDAGYTSLLMSYRNDGEAPRSADGLYALGGTEWRDVDAALEFAMSRGAKEIVLMGWSMGGATVLQTVTRSLRASAVTGIVLESPVIDWVTVLDYQGKEMGLARPLRTAVFAMLGRPWGRKFTGAENPIDLARFDFVQRAEELTVPILILHSEDDGLVPWTASHALAASRADLVTLEEFRMARHTRLWNYDPERWNAAISAWLARVANGRASSVSKDRSLSPRAAG